VQITLLIVVPVARWVTGWPGTAARLIAPRSGHSAPGHNEQVQIRIEARELPGGSCGPGPDAPGGHARVHVGVQRRGRPGELLGLVSGGAPAATWTLDCEVIPAAAGPDLRGPYIQGPPGGRFIYLSWVSAGDDGILSMFRRAKLWLTAVPPEVLREAAGRGALAGRLGLTDNRGAPRCAAVRPPVIEWSAAAPQ
jgi:hypothetical protein